MTLSYKFLSGGRGVEFKVLDRLTLTELIGVHSEINSSRNFAAQLFLYAWCEFGNEVAQVSITTAEVRGAAEAVIRTSSYQSIRRVTAIYAKNDVPFLRSQEWKGFIAPIAEVEVFRDRAAALEWLRKRVAEQHGLQIEL